MKNARILREIETLPDDCVSEVLNFISYLKFRNSGINELGLVAEQVLAKDWNTPEEDALWADL